MADYKPRKYTGQMGYTPKNPASQMDMKIKLYKPQNEIKDIPKTKTYDTKPPRQIKAKTYEKSTSYDSYSEYVPPWSRGKEKVERKWPKPKPQKAKRNPAKLEKVVTFATLPGLIEVCGFLFLMPCCSINLSVFVVYVWGGGWGHFFSSSLICLFRDLRIFVR